MKVFRCVVMMVLYVLALTAAFGQPKPRLPRSSPPKPSQGAQTPASPVDNQKLESANIDPNLITVPMIASTSDGRHVGDLTKDELKVTQDGVVQEITFMAKASLPLYVVLLIDASDSTKDKLGQLQQAAIGFVGQLDRNAKVKLISFNGTVRDWNEFTGDKSLVQGMIRQIQPDHDTRVYDAVHVALNALRSVQQRKALVIFTDGMDWHSESATFAGTLRALEEGGVTVYPIRFDTRATTERLAREADAAQNGSQLPTSDVVRRTTKPGDLPPNEPERIETKGISTSDIIFKGRGPRPNDPRDNRRTSPNDPNPSPNDDPTKLPDLGKEKKGPPQKIESKKRGTGASPPAETRPSTPPPADPITVMLDKAYETADSYLNALADRSGGKLLRADTIDGFPQAFAAVNAELRTQYLIGFHPKQGADEVYHKITVETSRKDVTIRSRPGYRAPAAN
jgi:Mg-chelatase subunit ChlD